MLYGLIFSTLTLKIMFMQSTHTKNVSKIMKKIDTLWEHAYLIDMSHQKTSQSEKAF